MLTSIISNWQQRQEQKKMAENIFAQLGMKRKREAELNKKTEAKSGESSSLSKKMRLI